MAGHVYLNSLADIKQRLKIQDNGPAEAFLVSTCAKKMDKYVPMKNGILAKYKIIDNYIIYDQVYAGYQYYGQRKDGTHVIDPANRDRSKHPLASSYWDEKMKSAEIDDVVKEVQNFIGGKK